MQGVAKLRLQSVPFICTPIKSHVLPFCTHFRSTTSVPTQNCTILYPYSLHAILGSLQLKDTYYSCFWGIFAQFFM